MATDGLRGEPGLGEGGGSGSALSALWSNGSCGPRLRGRGARGLTGFVAWSAAPRRAGWSVDVERTPARPIRSHIRTAAAAHAAVVRLVAVVPAALNLALGWIAVHHRGPPHPPILLTWLWIALLLLLPGIALQRWFGITLTPTHARIHNLRRRSIAWADVQAITDEPFFGVHRVLLWTADGRRIPLRAPMTTLGRLGWRRFERDYHQIGRWWLTHRGPNWTP